MSNISDINNAAWNLAIVSLMKDRNKIVPYSTSQIRNIINASQSEDFLVDVKKAIDDYKPAPPQGLKEQDRKAQENMQIKREKNRQLGKSLMDFMSGRNSKDVQLLLKYTLWNIKIIKELNKNNKAMSLLLECEGVDKPEEILSKINRLSSFSSGGQDNRRFNKGNRRR